jgi:selenocysteine-specific elongation factor
MPREELKSQAKLDDQVFSQVLEGLISDGAISQQGPSLAVKSFEIQFSPDQEKKIKKLMEQFKANPTQPPSVKECRETVDEAVYTALLDQGKLKQISSEVVFTPEDYQKMVSDLVKKIKADGPITVAQVRDLLGSSRKYVLAFLEGLDSEGVTVREGDVRRLK